MNIQQCKTCKFSRKYNEKLECRHETPLIFNAYDRAIFPIVNQEDWCRHYGKRYQKRLSVKDADQE